MSARGKPNNNGAWLLLHASLCGLNNNLDKLCGKSDHCCCWLTDSYSDLINLLYLHSAVVRETSETLYSKFPESVVGYIMYVGRYVGKHVLLSAR